MQAGTIDCAKVLLKQVITQLVQLSSRLLQCRFYDHDGAVRREKRQELADNRSPLCRRIGCCRKPIAAGGCEDHEIIGRTPHKLLTEIPFERMFQIALDVTKACAGYSHLLAIGLPQSL